MALNQEALTNLISADLASRNENWSEIDDVFDGTTPKPLAVSSGTIATSTVDGSDITSYNEGAPATQTHSANGALTLDLDNGNNHIVTVSANITSIVISNAPANKMSNLLLRLIPDDTHTYAWLATTSVISASTGVSAALADNSFNSSAAFADVLQAGDLITVSGFTDAETELNATHRVISATTSKIIVSTSITANEAAGQAVTIVRQNIYPSAPDNPTIYVPADYVLWTFDGVRWNVSQVGEF